MPRLLGVAAALAAILVLGNLAAAQAPALGEQQMRLRQANADAAAARGRAQQLERRAAAERDQAAQARVQEAAAAERIRASEAEIAAARARVGIVDRLLAGQRMRLAERQGPILRLVAALQSMARRPAVLGLVQPGSTADMVHVRAVLGTVVPAVEARSAAVRAEVARVRQLRDAAVSAVASFRAARTRIARQRDALVQLEAEHRARGAALGSTALVESDRAIALGEQARALVADMAQTTEAAALAADLAALPGPLPRPDDVTTPSRGGAAPYRLPVAGAVVTGFGELSDTGVRARGVTLACTAGARAVAPAAGRILYAARFRDYGGVVIIDHGDGWTSSVTGLASVAVRVGAQVAQGQAIGAAGPADPRITVELRRRGVPMDLVQLLS